MPSFLRILLPATALLVACRLPAAPETTTPDAVPGNHRSDIPSPPKPVFDVRNYGAKGDGKNYDTEAIRKAIDACAGSGGSVVLSGGTFLTAQLKLAGNMTFYIARDATLIGGLSPEDYPVLLPQDIAGDSRLAKEARDCRRSLLYADRADGLRLDGGGLIDGRGRLLTAMTGRESERPSLIRVFSSKDVSVRNLSLRNPRMWTQVYIHCRNLLIENLDVVSPHYAGNLDGMDLMDCTDAVVRRCDIDSEDDGICIKSNHPEWGVKNILVENNRVASATSAIKIGTATLGPVENVRILDNVVTASGYDAGVSFMTVDGGVLRDILVSGMDMSGVSSPFFFAIGDRKERRLSAKVSTVGPGRFENVVVEKVRVHDVRPDGKSLKGSQTAIVMGLPGTPLGGLTLRDLDIEMPGGAVAIPPVPALPKPDDYPHAHMLGALPAWGFFVRHADGVVFERIRIRTKTPDARPWRVSEKARLVDREITVTNAP